jgi:type I restriction enzyme M protein
MAAIASERELQRVAQRCHNVLWERHGFDPAQAFDELSKLIFTRLYDEAMAVGARTQPRSGQSPADFAADVRRLFAEAAAAPDFAGVYADARLEVDDLAIAQVFRYLRGYSLRATSTEVHGADVKGTIYERIVGSTFRGELGQFFTPRSLLEFMVRVVGVDESHVVYDPSCGSAGFLIMCARVLREQIQRSEPRLTPADVAARLREYSRERLVGTEINERTSRVARLSLLMQGLDYRNIFTANALKTEESADVRLRALVDEGTVDVVLANPPFAGYEKDPAVLARFELGRNGRGLPAAVTREVLFIERVLCVLREGGVAGVVVPQGIFANHQLARVREYVRRHAQILAIVELPDWAFMPSGTSVRGSLLFVRKLAHVPDRYAVFMKRVEHIGFSSTGRPSERNDLPATLEEIRRQDERYLVPIDELRDRMDARFHLVEHRRIQTLFRAGTGRRLVSLAEIGSFGAERVCPHAAPEWEIELVETSSVDPHTLTIAPRRILGRDSHYTILRRLRAGDVLISRRRAYRGAVVVVPAELEGALAIPEFSVLRLRPGYDADYVAELLRSAQFRQLMTIYSTGELSGRIAERDLGGLRLPLVADHRAVGLALRERRQRIAELRRDMAAEEESIAEICTRTIELGK